MMRIVYFALSILLLTSISLAQAPQGPPKPGPELKRLSYFAGTWKVDGKVQPGPEAPQGGTMASVDKTSWDLDGFFLATRSNGSFNGMPAKEVSYMGYDPQKKQYTYDAFSAMGAEHATGTVNGKTWTWTSEGAMGGQTVKSRGTITENSPTQYSMKFETSTDGGSTWKPSFEATATKQTGSSGTAGAAKKPEMK